MKAVHTLYHLSNNGQGRRGLFWSPRDSIQGHGTKRGKRNFLVKGWNSRWQELPPQKKRYQWLQLTWPRSPVPTKFLTSDRPFSPSGLYLPPERAPLLLRLWQRCSEGSDQCLRVSIAIDTPSETAPPPASAAHVAVSGLSGAVCWGKPLHFLGTDTPIEMQDYRMTTHLPAKYSGCHWLLNFLRLSRATPNTPHILATSVSTRSPNLADHYHA